MPGMRNTIKKAWNRKKVLYVAAPAKSVNPTNQATAELIRKRKAHIKTSVLTLDV